MKLYMIGLCVNNTLIFQGFISILLLMEAKKTDPDAAIINKSRSFDFEKKPVFIIRTS